MIIETLIVSMLVGWLRGGRLSGFGKLPFRGLNWFFAGVVLRFGTLALSRAGVGAATAVGPWIFPVSMLFVLIGALLNRRLPGVPLIVVGTVANLAAVAANGGSMPVSPAAFAPFSSQPDWSEAHFTHQLAGPGVRLPWLIDFIPIPPPYPLAQIISLGDIVICLGLFWLVQSAMLAVRRTADPLPHA